MLNNFLVLLLTQLKDQSESLLDKEKFLHRNKTIIALFTIATIKDTITLSHTSLIIIGMFMMVYRDWVLLSLYSD